MLKMKILWHRRSMEWFLLPFSRSTLLQYKYRLSPSLRLKMKSTFKNMLWSLQYHILPVITQALFQFRGVCWDINFDCLIVVALCLGLWVWLTLKHTSFGLFELQKIISHTLFRCTFTYTKKANFYPKVAKKTNIRFSIEPVT